MNPRIRKWSNSKKEVVELSLRPNPIEWFVSGEVDFTHVVKGYLDPVEAAKWNYGGIQAGFSQLYFTL